MPSVLAARFRGGAMAFLSPRHSSRSLMLIATLAWTTAMTTGARAQIAAADLRKAAEKIAAIQKEARLHEQRGHGAEAVRLREEAQKVWNETVGRIATSIEGKRRAEEAMSSIAANERGQAAAKELQAAASAWKSGQATASWMSQCTKGPAACLQGISKAKTAIEKGFDAASHQVDANVHVATAQQTEQIRAAKETQRRDLEKVRDALDRVSDPIDYPNDATSHNRDAPAPVAIHGELGENAAPARGGIYWDAVSASAATGSTVPGDDHPHPTDADYAALLDAVGSQGHVAGNSNAVSTGARDDSFRFASEFAQTETTERNRLKDATREIERSAKAADAIDVSTPASPPEATVPKSAQSSHPAASGDAPADPKRPITAKAAASTVPM
ncbi:MAG: hypothetical protein ACJ74H_02545, partial [Thermoanaerobaculia bacterium]